MIKKIILRFSFIFSYLSTTTSKPMNVSLVFIHLWKFMLKMKRIWRAFYSSRSIARAWQNFSFGFFSAAKCIEKVIELYSWASNEHRNECSATKTNRYERLKYRPKGHFFNHFRNNNWGSIGDKNVGMLSIDSSYSVLLT